MCEKNIETKLMRELYSKLGHTERKFLFNGDGIDQKEEEQEINEARHISNPIEVYRTLKDKGISDREALYLSKLYEENIYPSLNKFFDHIIGELDLRFI